MPKVLFTPQTAKEMAMRSVEARRLAKLAAPCANDASADNPTSATEPVKDILTRTRDHLDAIDRLIADCSDAREMDALTRSREREWRIFAHCSNLPGPGNLKPSSPKQSRSLPPVQPVALPTPADPEKG